MTPEHAAKLQAAQERLERDGWHFSVRYLRNVAQWSVVVSGEYPRRAELYVRDNRDDALSHAVNWASIQQSHGMEAASG